MIKVHLLGIRVPSKEVGLEQTFGIDTAYLTPHRIDTITDLDGKQKAHHVPERVRSVIRYIDVLNGYRLLYVAESAEDLAEAWGKVMRGDHPPEFPSY